MSHSSLHVKNSERKNWESKTEYILACFGYTIGSGNIWIFPYMCFKYGGAVFFVQYLLMFVIFGFPLYFLETSIGQFASAGCIKMFRMSPLFKGAGYTIVILNIFYISYYSILITYPLLFIWNTFYNILPWENCNNIWNTPSCMELSDPGISNIITNNVTITSPAYDFFYNKLLEMSGGIDEIDGIVWPIFWGTLLSWIILYACTANGIQSIGKVVYVTATFPILMLFALLVRGLTLPGSWEGIKYFIFPGYNQIINISAWAEASVLIFHSLGLGFGGIVSMASYNKFSNNNLLDSLLVPILSFGTSIITGFIVFSIFGFVAIIADLPVYIIARSDLALKFVTFPGALAMLPIAKIWIILFFVMLFLMGVGTLIIQIEIISSALADEYRILRRNKKGMTFGICLILFLMSINFTTKGGMYLIKIFDYYSVSIPIIAVCLSEIVMVAWTYGCENFARDIKFMNKIKINLNFLFCCKYLVPLILILIFISTIYSQGVQFNKYIFPQWSIILGWLTCLLSLICIPIYMFYYITFIKKGHVLERLQRSVKHNETWCPDNENIATLWKGHKEEIIALNSFE